MAKMNNMILRVAGIEKFYDVEDERITAVVDVGFEVHDGEFLTIVGPSGCGKSTVLRIIAGLEEQSKGLVQWGQKPEIGMVFQNYALFPFLTVSENIEFGLKMNGIKEKSRQKAVASLIEEVGLSGVENKHPKELSGGMKQRVGLARALAIEPNVLLLDEPFSSVDEFTAEELRKLLLALWHKRKITMIMVTHLVSEALELSDRVVVMTHSPGRVEKILPIELPRPRNLRSHEFFQKEDEIVRLIKG